MQCGEDGGGGEKLDRPIAYRATSGRLADSKGLESGGVGGRGVGRDDHRGQAEVYGRMEERRGGVDEARHRQEKREAPRLGKLLSYTEA